MQIITLDEENSPKPYTERVLRSADTFPIIKSRDVCYTSTAEYEDIYHFMLACSASKNTNNFYHLGSAKGAQEHKIQPYNIVSGDAFPQDCQFKPLIFKYMMQGLHAYWIFYRAGLFESKILSTRETTRTISAGNHHFQANDAWAINMSNIFIGMMIDYYQIRSGIEYVSSQLAFNSDCEYRFCIAKMLKSIFLSFIRKQTGKNPEDDMSIIRECALELKKLIE